MIANSTSSDPAAPAAVAPHDASQPWWRRFHPRMIPHAGWEMTIMRLLVAYFVWQSVAEMNLNLTAQPRPNGLAEWVDFTFWANPTVHNVLLVGLGIACALYATGWVILPALAYILFVMISAGTLVNSQGSIGHSTQLLAMCLLAEVVTLLYLYFRPTSHTGGTLQARHSWLTPAPLQHAQWGVHAIKTMIAAGYVSTGLCKVLATNGMWIWQSPLMAVQLKKANVMNYYDELVPGDPFFTETLPMLIQAHPMLARLAFGSALILELAACLALLSRGWALVLGLLLIGMHLSISVVMQLDFEYHIVLLAAFFVNVPYWVARVKGKVSARGTEAVAS